MSDLQPRTELWHAPVSRVAVAGSPSSYLAQSTLEALRAAPIQLIQRPLREPDGSIAREVGEADVLITGGASLDAAAFSQLGRVRFVLRPYVGYDDIDVDAATEQGVLFANVPDTFIEEVANHTLALVLACNRMLFPSDAYMRARRWVPGVTAREGVGPIRRASVLTLGLVGFGNIARLVVERARPFGFRLIASDPYVSPDLAAALGVEMVSLDDLLAQSDIVSLHPFLWRETRGLINAERLARMKPTAYLVNTSRGPVVDEPALIDALRAGQLAGAALDVMQTEPLPLDSPLLEMDNVILTPHIASYSIEGDIRHQARIAELALAVISGALPERKVVVNKNLYDVLAEQLQTAGARA